ncbi:hypothetical protein [Streptosporangium sp. NPDC000509]|uniref:hypothetical protein n=1 Tax=Streptosporangium sp. NPDC000509 TaxID=3366186 RepID=UPI00368A81AA
MKGVVFKPVVRADFGLYPCAQRAGDLLIDIPCGVCQGYRLPSLVMTNDARHVGNNSLRTSDDTAVGFFTFLSLGSLALVAAAYQVLTYSSERYFLKAIALGIIGIGFMMAAAAWAIYRQANKPVSDRGTRLRDDRPNEPMEP